MKPLEHRLEPLIILGHLGLGDHIILNGLVHAKARARRVFVPCKVQNWDSVADMFSCNPYVSVFPVAGDEEARAVTNLFQGEKLRLGLHRTDRPFIFDHWDRTMYEDAGVDFEKRWKYFRVARPAQAPVTGDIFIHEDKARGILINPKLLPIGMPVVPTRGRSMLSWIDNITRAREIHCIDSSFACLVDSLPNLKAKRLVLHLYARPNAHPPTYKKHWEII